MTLPGAGLGDGLAIAVVGLGKIGLALAAQFTTRGHAVIGCDVNPRVVATVNAGLSHVTEEPGLPEAVAAAVAAGRLRATSDTPGAVARSETVIVIVPLTLDLHGRVDFAGLDAATRSIGQGLRPGTLVIFETTLPVGTTDGRLRSILETTSSLRAGRDFHLAFSPERVYSGRIFDDLGRYPKIVGGADRASGVRAAAFFRAVLDAEVLEVANTETAEFTKLAEASYRDVNIALANQLALYAGNRGVDAVEAFRAANTQPYAHLHNPGIGVGGHCMPVYPHFLLQDAGCGELDLLRMARATNDRMAKVALDRLAGALGGLAGRRVLVLGLAYRENVKELAFSVGVRLVDLLERAGATVLVHDPLFAAHELAHLGAELADLSGPLHVDAVIVQAHHAQYGDLDWRRFRGLRVVLDGRGGLDPKRLGETAATYLALAAPAPGGPAQKVSS